MLLCSEAGRFITGTDIKIDGSLPCPGFASWGLTLRIRRLHNVLSRTRDRGGLGIGDPGDSCIKAGVSLQFRWFRLIVSHSATDFYILDGYKFS